MHEGTYYDLEVIRCVWCTNRGLFVVLFLFVQAVEDQFPLRNSHGELLHRIHTRRFCLKESYLKLNHSTEHSGLCDVAISDEGKVCIPSLHPRLSEC